MSINPTTGAITGTIPADASQVGPYTVTVTASDGQGGTVATIFTITSSNQAPSLVAPTPSQSTSDGSAVTLAAGAAFSDPNGDPLTYSATGLPAGLSINTSTGVITGTIDHSASQGGTGGVYAVTVTASDGKGATTSETFSYTVTNPAPVVVTPIADQGVTDGQAIVLSVASNFKDGAADTDTLTFSASGLPTGLSINAATGVITGTMPHDASVIGPYTVVVTANDGQGGTTSSTFTVSSTNTAPVPVVGGQTPPQNTTDGATVTLNTAGAFVDPNGDALAYSATGLPTGLSINAATGVISGTIDHSASQGGAGGAYSVTVTASDDKGGTVAETFTYTVTNPAPVVVTPIADQGVHDGQAFSLSVAGSFGDGGADSDTLTYSATGLPAGLALDPSTGMITGTIPTDASQTGPFNVIVTASDGQGGSVSTTFAILANNDFPAVVPGQQTPDQAATDGQVISLNTSNAFADPNGDALTYSVAGLPAGLSLDPTTGIISGTVDHSASQVNGGLYSVTVTASDGKGGSVSETFNFNVSNPAPVVATAIADQNVNDGDALALDVSPNFRDGLFDTDALTYSATGLPSGITIDPATGIIHGTIPLDASVTGPFTVVVSVTDGQGGSVTDTFILTSTNSAPIGTPAHVGAQSSNDGAATALDVSGAFADPNGDTLVYSASGLPAGLTIDSHTGVITGTIDYSASQGGAGGVHAVVVTADDGKGGIATEAFTWTVANPAPLVVAPIADQAVQDFTGFRAQYRRALHGRRD